MEKVNLAEKFNLIGDYWSPKIVGELNGQYVKLAKLKGEFTWHYHEEEDELFMVIHGELVIQLRDENITLKDGELLVIPAGVEHKPVALKETDLLIFEPKTTLNTGNVQNERTVTDSEFI